MPRASVITATAVKPDFAAVGARRSVGPGTAFQGSAGCAGCDGLPSSVQRRQSFAGPRSELPQNSCHAGRFPPSASRDGFEYLRSIPSRVAHGETALGSVMPAREAIQVSLRLQHPANHGGHLFPTFPFPRKLPSAGLGELIIAGTAVALRPGVP